MKQPDLRQLRYFLAVAEELHFGRAAEKVGIAQPPLTQQIQRLEQLLGCQLFLRGRKTQLTVAGVELAGEARRLLEQADHLFEMTRQVARGEAGPLRVGVPPSVMLTDLPTAVRKYRQRYPKIGFTLRELSTSAIEAALQSGDIDVGFLRETRPAKDGPLETGLFLTEPVVAVLPGAHPQARAMSGKFRVGALKNELFVFFPRRLGPEFYDQLTGACAAAGFAPKVVQEATQWSTVVSLVEAGMGISLAPACVTMLTRRNVVSREVSGLTTNVYAAWRRQDLSEAARQFLQLAGVTIKPT